MGRELLKVGFLRAGQFVMVRLLQLWQTVVTFTHDPQPAPGVVLLREKLATAAA